MKTTAGLVEITTKLAAVGCVLAGFTLCLATAPKVAAAATAKADKPNIVFILTDNLGYGEIGSYGGGVTRGAATPRIDSLAK